MHTLDLLLALPSLAVPASAQLGGPTLIGLVDAASTNPRFQAGWQDGVATPIVLCGRSFFVASVPGIGRELCVTDGTPEGTLPFLDLNPGPGSSFPIVGAVLDDWLFGVAYHPAKGIEPFASDGTVAGTVHADLTPGTGFAASPFAGALDGVAYFLGVDVATSKYVPWRCDGPAGGFSPIAFAPGDLPPGFAGFTGPASGWSRAGGALWFAAPSAEHGFELWRLDPTVPRLEVHDLVPGPASSYPSDLVVTGDGALWLHATYLDQSRLLRIDAQGALTDVKVLGGPGFVAGKWPVLAVGDQVFFEVDGDPWASDGTALGTRMLADLSPPQLAPPYDGIAGPVEAGGAVFFWHDAHQGVGPALYRATLSPDAVQLVDPVDPDLFVPPTFQPLWPLGSGALVAYRRLTPAHGLELWVTDGGPPVQATEIAPGPASMTPDLDPLADPSSLQPYVPSAWQRVGSRFLVEGDDGVTGLEPHAIPIAGLGGWVAEPYGPSCGPRIGSGGTARAGDVLEVRVDGPPLSPARLYLGSGPTLQPLALGCALLCEGPVLVVATTTDASGRAAVALPVPPFVGFDGAFQWLIDDAGAPVLSDGLEVVIGP